MGGERATGRPADGAGRHPKGWNNVEDARSALRPGAAGLKGSDAHPIAGVKRPTKRPGRRSPGPIGVHTPRVMGLKPNGGDGPQAWLRRSRKPGPKGNVRLIILYTYIKNTLQR